MLNGTSAFRKHHPIVSGEMKTLRVNNSVLKTLECPVCMDIMYPPIHQCLNGHTLCSTCKDKIHNRCPICSREMAGVRCLALEHVAISFEFPCRYQDLGCHDILIYDKKLEHEKICDFRPYNCPYSGDVCPVTGDAHFLASHLKSVHRASFISMKEKHTFSQSYGQNTDNRQIKWSSWTETVLSCFDKHFCLSFQAFLLDRTLVYMSFLQFMGSDAEARKFKYSIAVDRGDTKLVWEGVPRSIRVSHTEIRNSQDGLIIPSHQAHFFSGGDGKKINLTISGNISKRR